MKSYAFLITVLAAVVPLSAAAQHSPYAGEQAREIKALSPASVEQYLAGAGMGYARAAELNRHPGPQHVLELASELALTPAQRAATEALMASHKQEARGIGARLVAAEQALDRIFATGGADQSVLAQQVAAVAAVRGEYRLSHLETHRRMRALLSDEQVMQYSRLRGYETNAGGHGKRHGHH